MAIKSKLKTPDKEQEKALTAILAEFKVADRCQIHAATGFGKSLVGVELVKRLGADHSVYFAPTLALLNKAYHDLRDQRYTGRILMVCGDPRVVAAKHNVVVDFDEVHDPLVSVTTKKKEIAKFLKDGPGVVVCTYKSSALLRGDDADDDDDADVEPEEATDKLLAGLSFGLGVFDESHHTTGRSDKQAAFAVEDTNVKIDKRFFMTATPAGKKRGRGQNEADLYGKIVYKMPFSKCVAEGRIVDFQFHFTIGKGEIEEEEAEKAQWLADFADEVRGEVTGGPAKFIVFTRLTSTAKQLCEDWTARGREGFFLAGTMPMSSKNGKKGRNELLEEFGKSKAAWAFNAKCLSEGVDVPDANGIVFFDPKKSVREIVQGIGRGVRKPRGSSKKHCIVGMPVRLPPGEDPNGTVARTRYRDLFATLRELSEATDTMWSDQEEVGKHAALKKKGEPKAMDRLRKRMGKPPKGVSRDTWDEVIVEDAKESIGIDADWEKNYRELRDYLDAHDGKYPSANSRGLGDWIHNQRAYFKNGDLIDVRRQMLEALPAWSWRDERADKAFNRVKDWYVHHQRAPLRHSKDPEEAFCGRRIMHIRQDIKKNSNPEEVARYRTIPLWSDNANTEKADKAFNRVSTFYARHKKDPSQHSKDPEERFCGRKVNGIRQDIKQKRNAKEVARYRTIPLWKDFVKTS